MHSLRWALHGTGMKVMWGSTLQCSVNLLKILKVEKDKCSIIQELAKTCLQIHVTTAGKKQEVPHKNHNYILTAAGLFCIT